MMIIKMRHRESESAHQLTGWGNLKITQSPDTLNNSTLIL